MTSLTLLAVVAHPDDEGSCGGSLAKYAAAGARVFVACATRGDGPDAQIKNDAATRETLGQVRSQELACACQALGLPPPLFLGYQDGAVGQAPPAEAARAVAGLIRQLRPQVVITHDPGGGYGHPDHIAVNGFVTAAFGLAGDPAAEVQGAPFQPAKLYYFAIPRSFKEFVPALRDRRAEIGGQVLGFLGVPDEQITTAVDIRAWLRAKLNALKCHRSQFELDPATGDPKTFAASLPESERLKWFGHERFVLAQSTVTLRPEGDGALEADLFTGLH
jgi:N-acetyl-1-D-myo-inositol-2-amino-2-deoxy-alpha-D-glucopyranoside deacetylase